MQAQRRRRLLSALALVALGGVGLAGLYRAMLGSSGLFLAPAAVAMERPLPGQSLRVGGWVVPGSFRRASGDPLQVSFLLSDGEARVLVQYRGVLPDLFAEGEQAAARGRWSREPGRSGGAEGTERAGEAGEAVPGHLQAVEILAKHDENYSPPLGEGTP